MISWPPRANSARVRGGLQKAARRREEVRLVKQKRVMPFVALDLDKRDGVSPAFSACTIARDAVVGYSQSEVKEITQNRVLAPEKARAKEPP